MALDHLIFQSGDLGGNTGLFWCTRTREALLVDPAGEPEEILDLLLDRGLALRAIALTHAHPDNLLAAPVLAEQTTCDLWLHREDFPLWEGLPELCREFGWPVPEFGEPHEWLVPGAPLAVGREHLEVVHLPGHSPGSVGFVARELELALVGDTLFREGRARADLVLGDETALEASLDLLAQWPSSWRVVPGHGPAWSPSEVPRLRQRRSALL